MIGNGISDLIRQGETEMLERLRGSVNIEKVAIGLYEADGMALAIYSAQESWPLDRVNVRERYRARARQLLDERAK